MWRVLCHTLLPVLSGKQQGRYAEPSDPEPSPPHRCYCPLPDHHRHHHTESRSLRPSFSFMSMFFLSCCILSICLFLVTHYKSHLYTPAPGCGRTELPQCRGGDGGLHMSVASSSLAGPMHPYQYNSDRRSDAIRYPVIPVEHAEACQLLQDLDGNGYR